MSTKPFAKAEPKQENAAPKKFPVFQPDGTAFSSYTRADSAGVWLTKRVATCATPEELDGLATANQDTIEMLPVHEQNKFHNAINERYTQFNGAKEEPEAEEQPEVQEDDIAAQEAAEAEAARIAEEKKKTAAVKRPLPPTSHAAAKPAEHTSMPEKPVVQKTDVAAAQAEADRQRSAFDNASPKGITTKQAVAAHKTTVSKPVAGTPATAKQMDIEDTAAETKEHKFRRMANARATRAAGQITLLKNLANRGAYDYTDDDIAKLFAFLRESLDSTEQYFKNQNKAKPQLNLFG